MSMSFQRMRVSPVNTYDQTMAGTVVAMSHFVPAYRARLFHVRESS